MKILIIEKPHVALIFVALSLMTNCQTPYTGLDYYIDSVSGSDDNTGTVENSPWKSLAKVSRILNSWNRA